MARRTSHANLRVPADEDGFGFGFDEEEEGNAEEGEEEEVDRLPVKRAQVTVPIPIVAEPLAADDDGGEGAGYEDLVARTRRSMAGFEAAKKKAQLERRRSLRNSKLGGGPSPSTQVPAGKGGYFPAVDEEEGDSTLLIAEELISKGRDDDYEAVFMSRPKLKNSPVGTPTRDFWD
jgi:hypothetical protein